MDFGWEVPSTIELDVQPAKPSRCQTSPMRLSPPPIAMHSLPKRRLGPPERVVPYVGAVTLHCHYLGTT